LSEERHCSAPLCSFSSHPLSPALAGESLSCKKVSRPRFIFDEHDASLRRFHHISCVARKGTSVHIQRRRAAYERRITHTRRSIFIRRCHDERFTRGKKLEGAIFRLVHHNLLLSPYSPNELCPLILIFCTLDF